MAGGTNPVTSGGGEDGYTLLETLVAFSILVAALITSFDIFNFGLQRLSSIEDSRFVADVARAELDRVALRSALSESSIVGRTGSVSWEIVISSVKLDGGHQLSEIYPFEVQFRRLSEDGSSPPETILETIVLSKSAAP